MPPGEKPKFHRRHYWINPKFQGRYLRTILGLEVLVMAFTALFTSAMVLYLTLPAFEPGADWNRAIYYFIALAAVMAAILVYLGIRASHRICGASFHIEKTLEAIVRGESPGPIRLRNGDELQDLADKLNEALTALNQANSGSQSSD